MNEKEKRERALLLRRIAELEQELTQARRQGDAGDGFTVRKRGIRSVEAPVGYGEDYIIEFPTVGLAAWIGLSGDLQVTCENGRICVLPNGGVNNVVIRKVQ